VVTAAGNVTHEQVLELVQREFGGMSPTGPADSDALRAPRHPFISKPSATSNRCIYASASRRFHWATKTASLSLYSTIFSAAACLRAFPEHSREARPRLNGHHSRSE